MAKDYYKILGIDRDANAKDAEIKKAFRTQSLIWAVDKWSPDKEYSGVKKTYAEVESRQKDINEAYETLIDSQKRFLYHQQEGLEKTSVVYEGAVPADKQRQNEPKTENELLNWLRYDSHVYQNNESLKQALLNPAYLPNIFKLIQLKRLCYRDIQDNIFKEKFAWDVIFCSAELTEYTAGLEEPYNKLPETPETPEVSDSSNEPVFFVKSKNKPITAVRKLVESFSFKSDNVAEYLEDSSKMSGLESFTEEDRFLLYLLHNWREKEGNIKSISCMPYSEDQIWLNELGLESYVFKWVVHLIHCYRSADKAITLASLIQQINFAKRAVYSDSNYLKSLKNIYSIIIEPAQRYIAELEKDPTDRLSAIQAGQMRTVVKDYKKTVKDKVEGWIQENAKDPQDHDALFKNSRIKRKELYREICDKVDKHSKADTIDVTDKLGKFRGKFYNKIGGFLKQLLCIALCTLGVGLLSSTIRQTAWGMSGKQRMLADGAEKLEEEFGFLEQEEGRFNTSLRGG